MLRFRVLKLNYNHNDYTVLGAGDLDFVGLGLAAPLAGAGGVGLIGAGLGGIGGGLVGGIAGLLAGINYRRCN